MYVDGVRLLVIIVKTGIGRGGIISAVLSKGVPLRGRGYRQPVIGTWPDGTERRFAMVTDAAALGCRATRISDCLSGRMQRHHGATWRYA